MIAYLNGTILKKLEKAIILDTGKIGYLVNLPGTFLAELEKNDTLELYIYTNVLEDDLSLYGFRTSEELDFFKNLIGISGIGPRIGLEILTIPLSTLRGAIANEDTNSLSKIPGIGKKTAERIILEMKNKITISDDEREYKGLGPEIDEDAVNALVNFGYQKHQIVKALKNMPEEIKGAEEIIKYFLQNA